MFCICKASITTVYRFERTRRRDQVPTRSRRRMEDAHMHATMPRPTGNHAHDALALAAQSTAAAAAAVAVAAPCTLSARRSRAPERGIKRRDCCRHLPGPLVTDGDSGARSLVKDASSCRAPSRRVATCTSPAARRTGDPQTDQASTKAAGRSGVESHRHTREQSARARPHPAARISSEPPAHRLHPADALSQTDGVRRQAQLSPAALTAGTPAARPARPPSRRTRRSTSAPARAPAAPARPRSRRPRAAPAPAWPRAAPPPRARSPCAPAAPPRPCAARPAPPSAAPAAPRAPPRARPAAPPAPPQVKVVSE